jgi:SAM-dependent methyltransferase
MDPEKLAVKYHGNMAATYDSLREGTPQWTAEQAIVEDFLSIFEAGTTVLDVPVGTGRFLHPYLRMGFLVTGLDVSESMLALAGAKLEEDPSAVTLQDGSIFSLDFPDDSFDLTVCMRFCNWVTTAALQKALAELTRVTSGHLIVSIPTYMPLREIGIWTRAGAARLMRQWKLRLYLLRTRSEDIIHSRAVVLASIEALGLRIVERICIDGPDDTASRRAYERDIYLLQKGE